MRLRRRLLPAETAAAGGADTGLVGKLRRSAAVRYSREGCGSLADAARDLHVLLADPRRTIEKGLVAREVNDELGAGV
jgi:hypothetical protein